MRKSRFTDEKGTVAPDGAAQAPTNRSSGCIKEQEAGMATSEVCRRHGISLATFHQLRARHGGQVWGHGRVQCPGAEGA